MPQAKLKVVLIAHTPQPEKVVATAAKLCYSPANIDDLREKIAASDQKKFVEKLASLGHLSPIEHISFTFAVEGISRVCTHQLVRHRIASYSQQSQRYVSEHSQKHGGLFDFIIPPSIEAADKKEWFIDKMRQIQKWYDELVETLGDKGEETFQDARFILPNAAETKIILTMNARELLHFIRVRTCLRAQWEIRELAEEMLRGLLKVAPTVFGTSGPPCLSGPCPEGAMTCGKMEEVRHKFRQMHAGA